MMTVKRFGSLGAVVALLALVLLGQGAWAGSAGAAPPDSLVSKVGKGFAALVEEEISSLCMGKEDTGRDDDEATTTETPDPTGTTTPAAPSASGCDINDAELQKAAEKCASDSGSGFKEKATAEEVSADKDDFLKCMAGEGFGKEDKEEDEPEKKDAIANLSLSRVSSALSAFYVSALSPDGETGDDEDGETSSEATEEDASKAAEAAKGLAAWAPILQKPASAGSFLAAPDQSKQESNNWVLGANDSANSATISYTMLDRTDGGKFNDDAPDSGVYKYAMYGAMLHGMGYDTAMTADDSAAITRNGMGVLMIAAYTGAGAVDVVFDSVVGILQKLNPFGWMVDAITEHTDPTFTQGMQGTETLDDDSAFDGLKEFFGKIYDGVVQIGWMVTIPLFIGITVFGMMMMKRFETGKNLKALAIRIAFLVIGIPLLGVTYTGALDSIQGASGDSAKANSTKVVLSTYVDFESWVEETRLAPPEGAPNDVDFWWNTDDKAPNGESIAKGRATALSINSQLNCKWSRFAPEAGQSDTTWNGSVTDKNEGEASGVPGTNSCEGNEDSNTFSSVMDLLNRYRSGARMDAGSYESNAKAGLRKQYEANPENAKAVLKWVTDLSSVESLRKMDGAAVGKLNNPLIQVQENAGLRSWQSPGSDQSQLFGFARGEGMEKCSSFTTTGINRSGPGEALKADDPSVLSPCNLAPMAMFNYLNTDFGATSARMYSPSAVTSEYSRVSHMSVNSVGTGAAQALYWFSAMTILVSFVIIGFLYAMSMLISCLKRGFQLISNVPFATMGFMAGIAKTITYTVAMFLEIFGTIFVYKIVQEVLMIVPSLLEKPLVNKLSEEATTDDMIGLGSAVAGTVVIGSQNIGTVVLVVTLVSSIGIIMFTMMAIKLRSTLLQGIDAAVTRVVNKFTDTQVSGGLDPGSPGTLKQGVARGVGMAATSAAFGGGGGSDSGSQGGEGGEGGVEQGTGEGVPGAGDGSTSVGAGGGLLDQSGNPVMGADGKQSTVSGMLGGDGPLTDGSGGEIIGASGSPLTADDVTGFGPGGELLGEGGVPMTDNDGNPLTNANAAKMAGDLTGQKAMASQVARNGLSNQENAAGVPVGALGNFGGVAPASAPVETGAAPRPGNLRADSGSDGGSGVVRQTAGMMAGQVVQQQMLGGNRRPMEAMGGSGKSKGSPQQQGGGGQNAMGGMMPKRPGAASQAMSQAGNMGMMHMMNRKGKGSDSSE